MARSRRKKQASVSAASTPRTRQRPSPKPQNSSNVVAYLGVFVLGVAVTLGASFGRGAFQATEPTRAAQQTASLATLDSHHDLLAMTPEELGKVDLAVMNLLCAKGLPGAEGLDIPAVLAKLDEWAERVRFETERHLYRVADPKYAEHYNHSEARLRAEFIVQVLQEDCGVRYNVARIRDVDFGNSKDLFLHGMAGSNNGGTCASMPVLYTVIGRRLGYPIKLVAAKEHLFCRWDGPNERFNIEGATNGSVSFYEDEHYKQWPLPLTDEELATGEFLKSMRPAQELATFLLHRGSCYQAHNRWPEARETYASAHRLAPNAIFQALALKQSVLLAPMPGVQTARQPRRQPMSGYVRDLMPKDPTPKVPMPGSAPPRP